MLSLSSTDLNRHSAFTQISICTASLNRTGPFEKSFDMTLSLQAVRYQHVAGRAWSAESVNTLQYVQYPAIQLIMVHVQRSATCPCPSTLYIHHKSPYIIWWCISLHSPWLLHIGFAANPFLSEITNPNNSSNPFIWPISNFWVDHFFDIFHNVIVAVASADYALTPRYPSPENPDFCWRAATLMMYSIGLREDIRKVRVDWRGHA